MSRNHVRTSGKRKPTKTPALPALTRLRVLTASATRSADHPACGNDDDTTMAHWLAEDGHRPQGVARVSEHVNTRRGPDLSGEPRLGHRPVSSHEWTVLRTRGVRILIREGVASKGHTFMP